MATSAPIQPGLSTLTPSGAGWSRVSAWLPPWIVLAVSAVELALANRKYGLFTGGFGQSRAVDSLPELALFLTGYGAVQALLAIAGWALACRLARGKPGWVAVYLFALVNGALFCGLLAAQYQLHSYFSDAVGFTLIKQLGGGSLVDAIKFGLSEIGVALLGLAFAALMAWGLWRILGRVLSGATPSGRPAPRKLAWSVAALFLVAAFAIPRTGSDAAFGLNRTLGWQGATGLLNLVSDVDRDGYGLFAIQYDPAPFDSTRHPLALDIPGNGIDEDGYGGDLELVPLPEPLPAQVLAGRRPHVVVVVLESVRYDVLGKRINGKVVAPNLEALAAEGSAVVPAYSHVGFTTESLKSVFSGQLVPQTGDPSLFTELKQSGYRIGVYSGQPEDFGDISATVSMRKSADVHIDAETLREKRAFEFAAKGSLLVAEEHLMAAFDRTLGAGTWDAPHFLYFNFQSAHFPYHHDGVELRVVERPVRRNEMKAENAAAVQATYWNAVAHADAWLGEVVARLKARGVWDDTILIVTGDHGEDLFEDGFLGHGHVINTRQYGTMLVSNRPGILPEGPVSMSDYRAILVAAMRGKAPPRPLAPFLYIGVLDKPTAIGLAGPGKALTSLRLDTGEACFVEQGRCSPYPDTAGPDRARVDQVIARWGSERWRERQRP
ncbi:sulfatase-like hydrolase/transferase [Altererythrobacter sp. H2]|uniref:sulfatase-like hydrolase/transferase n=1 Tax=Altererythrobacter sp. H2 TaxID=3108391 RepID=UPI002B4BD687|nr:sulfatase-like hydrolase/transferase [Altererythrobacter sp. H2]WRK96304.1 sulfatase-like hydrolase/transferase [Altererythrobacter sp. H2]